MKHASELDLIAYEDPVFYDRLERARVQATDRLGMIQSIGRLEQQIITAISMSIAVVVYSPWLMLMLVAGVIPAFLGKATSHFWIRQEFPPDTHPPPTGLSARARRQQEAAKELKLLAWANFLLERFTRLSDQIYVEDVASPAAV